MKHLWDIAESIKMADGVELGFGMEVSTWSKKRKKSKNPLFLWRLDMLKAKQSMILNNHRMCLKLNFPDRMHWNPDICTSCMIATLFKNKEYQSLSCKEATSRPGYKKVIDNWPYLPRWPLSSWVLNHTSRPIVTIVDAQYFQKQTSGSLLMPLWFQT